MVPAAVISIGNPLSRRAEISSAECQRSDCGPRTGIGGIVLGNVRSRSVPNMSRAGLPVF